MVAGGRHFNGLIRVDRSGFGSGDTLVLYFGAIQDPNHVQGALDYVSNPSYWRQINVEEESYIPEVLFRYGRPNAAYQVLFDLASPHKSRREYPEVSYAIVAAIICGAMGIEPAHTGESFDYTDTAAAASTRGRLICLVVKDQEQHLGYLERRGHPNAYLVNREGPTFSVESGI